MYLYLKFLILVSKIKILQEEEHNGNATYVNGDGSVRAMINPPEPKHSYEFSWELSYLKDLWLWSTELNVTISIYLVIKA